MQDCLNYAASHEMGSGDGQVLVVQNLVLPSEEQGTIRVPALSSCWRDIEIERQRERERGHLEQKQWWDAYK